MSNHLPAVLGATVAVLVTAVVRARLQRSAQRTKRGECAKLKQPRNMSHAAQTADDPHLQPKHQQRRSRFRRRQGSARVVCCSSNKSYIATIERVVEKGDRVLVIGRHGKHKSASLVRAEDAAGGDGTVVAYGGALWDVMGLQAAGGGAGFNIVCIEPGDVFGNDVVVDGLAVVRLIRSLFGRAQSSTPPNATAADGGGGGSGRAHNAELRFVIVKSRNLASHSRSMINVHRITSGSLEVELPATTAEGEATASSNDHHVVPIVVSAVGVRDYRNVIPHVVVPGDTVLEIGCALGKTTHLIGVRASSLPVSLSPSSQRHRRRPGMGRVIGVDNGRRCIRDARAQHDKRWRKACEEAAQMGWDVPLNPQTDGESTGNDEDTPKNCTAGCEFEVADAWDTAGLLRLSPFFNCIFIDVGGISGSDGELEALALVRQLLCAFGRNQERGQQLRAIVLKSRCLRDHANVWWHADDLQHHVVDHDSE